MKAKIDVTFKPTYMIVSGTLEYRDEKEKLIQSDEVTYEYAKDKNDEWVQVKQSKVIS